MNWFLKLSQTKLLILARGPSGSGKSFMVKELAAKYNAPIFSTDEFFVKDGEYQFNPKLIPTAHKWNQQRAIDAMQQGIPVIIIDNTNTKLWEMKPYVQAAQQFGYQVEFQEPNWNENLRTPEGKWNADFLKQMQHTKERDKNIPDEVIDRMVNHYDYNPSVERILGTNPQ